MRTHATACLILQLAFAFSLAAQNDAAEQQKAEPIASLHPSNYVNDFAGVLDAATLARLNDLCRQVDQKAQAQIAVVTVKSVDGQDVVSYAVALYQKWGIGGKGKDRGVLILLATEDRKHWTTVGYGLEPILPDGKVGGFGREAAPLVKSGDYAGAVTLMTVRVASVIAQDARVTLDNQPRLGPNTLDRGTATEGSSTPKMLTDGVYLEISTCHACAFPVWQSKIMAPLHVHNVPVRVGMTVLDSSTRQIVAVNVIKGTPEWYHSVWIGPLTPNGDGQLVRDLPSILGKVLNDLSQDATLKTQFTNGELIVGYGLGNPQKGAVAQYVLGEFWIKPYLATKGSVNLTSFRR